MQTHTYRFLVTTMLVVAFAALSSDVFAGRSHGKKPFDPNTRRVHSVNKPQQLRVGASPKKTVTHQVSITYGKSVDSRRINAINNATISGIVFDDLDGNAHRTVNEPGLDAWEIELHQDTPGGTLVATETTDVSGTFSFADVAEGTYAILEVVDPDWGQSLPSSPDFYTVIVGPSTTAISDLLFGNFPLGSISGIKFNDIDDDCLQDLPTEIGLPNWVVRLDPGPRYAVTDSDGYYEFKYLPSDLYTISELPKARWTQTCPTGDGMYDVFIAPGDTDLDNDFGNQADSSFRDMRVSVAGGVARPGFIKLYAIRYENAGTTTIPSVTIIFTHPANSTFIDTTASIPPTDYFQGTRTATWVLTDLIPGTVGTITLWVQLAPPPAIVDGMTLTSSAHIHPTHTDDNPVNNDDNETEQVRSSSPPNEALVYPEGLAPNGGIPSPDLTLTYQVNFQNTGMDTVFTVIIRDTLDDNLDTTTFVSGASSHPYLMVVENGNEVTWTFTDIHLPPSIANESESHGFVKFNIRPLLTTPVGTDIFNHASISFDFNNSVNTNTVQNQIIDTTGGERRYRTFTASQLAEPAQSRLVRPSDHRTPFFMPNTANIIYDIYKQGKTLIVGKTGQLNIAGKENAYLFPYNQAQVFKTFYMRGVTHDGVPHGLDRDNTAHLMIRGWRILPATKHNNRLLANLLALQVNMKASDLAKTPTGFPDLLYDEGPGNPLSGMTVDEIANFANDLMSNWGFHTLAEYLNVDTTVAKINAAFSKPLPFDGTDTLHWKVGKLALSGVRPVSDVAFFSIPPHAHPRTHHDVPLEQVGEPLAFSIEQNYPNPFNPTTTIEFAVPQESWVSLKVYNVLGQEVATLIDHDLLEEGFQDVTFDASAFPSGVYFYRVQAEGIADAEQGIASLTFTSVRKMLLLK